MTNRRNFLKTSALAAAGLTIVPRHVLGRGYLSPSDKLNLAAIGAGGKGTSDIRNAWNDGKENVVAICDIDTQMAAESIKKWPKAKVYHDYRRMFEEMKGSIDAVTISAPDHIHGVAAMAAMQLGIHVYVQKPLTHNIAEARKLTEAARQYKIVSQMGNQGASIPDQVCMMEWFSQGLIGTVSTIYVWTDRPVWPQGIPVPKGKPRPSHISPQQWDSFIGPADFVEYDPLYHPFKWRGWWNFGTGALGDMGCHMFDPAFRVLGLGYPTEVECSVGQIFLQDWVPEYIPEGCPPSSSVQLRFPATDKNPVPSTMYWTDGGIRPFHPDLIPPEVGLGTDDSSNGMMLIGTKGIITSGVYGAGAKLYLPGGEVRTMPKDYDAAFDGGRKYSKLPEHGHQVYWTDAIKAGFGSPEHKALTSSFDYSGPLTEAVLMGNLAIRSYQTFVKKGSNNREFVGRRKLLWDGKAMRITNFDDANQFVSRNYRKGWEM